MENNLHDDKLDDYVRKSFEDYEEDPAPDMWGRVEGGLLPIAEEPSLRVAFFWRHRWPAAAAAVILLLLSTLVCEHFYYQDKLRALSAKPAEAEGFSTEKPSEEAFAPVGKSSGKTTAGDAERSMQMSGTNGEANGAPDFIHEPQQQEGLAQGGKTFAPSGQKPFTANHPTALRDKRPLLDDAHTVLPSLKKSDQAAAHVAPPENTVAGHISNPHSPNLVGSENLRGLVVEREGLKYTPLALARLDTAVAAEATTSQPDMRKMSALPPISPRIVLLETSIPQPSALKPLRINPLREPSGWYVGAQATLLATVEKNRAPVTRPGRPVFASQQENPEISAIWWLRVGKKLNTRLLLESGIGYQKTTQTATHSPRFRFGDGTGPITGTRRTFNYNLSTYSGTAEVSLRMEQTNPTVPPPADNEQVPLKITTTERAELLRVPLLAAYQLGTGRLRGQLKAGLVGNFFLKNELDISAQVSQNARLRPLEGRSGYSVSLGQPKKFALGYWLSAGAEFKLSRHLSLVAEPSFAGDFARKDASGQRLPERLAWGLNVGAQYCF